MTKLSNASLGMLAPNVAVPAYDRARITDGIAHIGVGGFHRAHQAVYLDDLMQNPGVTDWGICGVGLLPHDKRMQEALLPQDCLYTVVARSADEDKARVIGSLTRDLFAPENPEAVLAVLASPQIRIVSLTITEGGYNFNQTTGEFDGKAPDIVHDLADPQRPVSVFGYLAEALQRRRGRGIAPFTVLSCDNIQSNGAVARKMVLAFAALRDPALHEWIARNVAFPNCMVDRITPQTTDADRALVRDEFGIEDAWPVVTEPFRQWVIEDAFCDGRPPYEEAGAQMTSDVHPYEMMKIRLLNASHSAMGYLGSLAGFRYIHEIITNDAFRRYIREMMDDEVTPLLAPVPGVDLAEYKATLLTRFANPRIKDQASRICLDGSAKMPKFLLPSIREELARGGPIRFLSLAVAGWCRYLTGVDEQGHPIRIEDPMAQTLQERARAGGSDPRPLLGIHEVFGDLADSPRFVGEVGAALQRLYAGGAQATVAEYVRQAGPDSVKN